MTGRMPLAITRLAALLCATDLVFLTSVRPVAHIPTTGPMSLASWRLVMTIVTTGPVFLGKSRPVADIITTGRRYHHNRSPLQRARLHNTTVAVTHSTSSYAISPAFNKKTRLAQNNNLTNNLLINFHKHQLNKLIWNQITTPDENLSTPPTQSLASPEQDKERNENNKLNYPEAKATNNLKRITNQPDTTRLTHINDHIHKRFLDLTIQSYLNRV